MSQSDQAQLQLRLPEPLLSAVQACEVICVAGCCGLYAFDFNSEHILQWIKDQDHNWLWEALDQLSEVIGEVDEHGGQVWSPMDGGLDLFFQDSAQCLGLLWTVQQTIIRAAEVMTRRPLFDLIWRTSTAVGLASTIYAERAFDRLPILADALEDAGCDNPDVLAHCRGDGPHARGCWVVDLILGKV